MKFSENDFREVKRVATLVKKIDSIDSVNVNSVLDEIFLKQPFFLTVMIGYRFDTTPLELDEIMRVYFLIWEYFRPYSNIQTKKLTEDYFEKIQNKYIDMLKSADRATEEKKTQIYTADLMNLKSKALLTAVFYRFNSGESLSNMDPYKKAIILIGIKSFIICFERI